MTRARLTFADRHIDPVRDGQKYVTARVGFDRGVRPGDRVVLVDTNDARFASVRVCWVNEMTAIQFVTAEFDGHRTYDRLGAFLDELRGYYPDVTIGPETMLTVLTWPPFADVRLDTSYDDRYSGSATPATEGRRCTAR